MNLQKKVLIICNTYYQLIVAIQLKLTIKQNDYVHVVLTNKSKNADQIYSRLSAMDLFEKITYLDVEMSSEHKVPFLNSVKCLIWGVYGKWKKKFDEYAKYDELLSYNLDLPAHFLYAILYNRNPKIEVNQFEEGVFSYDTEVESCNVLRLLYKMRKLMRKKNLRESVMHYYCFNPIFYKRDLQTVQIPKLGQDEKVKKVLRDIFVPSGKIDEYNEKYILLTCIYDLEGGGAIGELEVARKIADVVGMDNLIVKVHPRDDSKRFIDLGFKVDVNSTVPWEIIQMNLDFSEKVIMTTLSCSPISLSAISEEEMKAMYLFPLCSLDNNQLAKHYSNVITQRIEEINSLTQSEIQIIDDLNIIL